MEPIYVVLIINLIIWSGIFIQIFNTNKQIKNLSQKIDRLEKTKN